MKAVGELDLVDGAVHARPRVGESVGGRGYGEHPSSFGDEAMVGERRARVEHGHALNLLGSVDLSDEAAASRRPGVASSGDDHRDRMFAGEPGLNLVETSGRDSLEQLGEVAI